MNARFFIILVVILCTVQLSGQKAEIILGGGFSGGKLWASEEFQGWNFKYVYGGIFEFGVRHQAADYGISVAAERFRFTSERDKFKLTHFNLGLFVDRAYDLRSRLNLGWQFRPFLRYYHESQFGNGLALYNANLGLGGGIFMAIRIQNASLRFFVNYQHDVHKIGPLLKGASPEEEYPTFRGLTIGTGIRW